jgi:hypothetical protein
VDHPWGQVIDGVDTEAPHLFGRRTLPERRRENLHRPPRVANRREVSLMKRALVQIGLLTYSFVSSDIEHLDEMEEKTWR